MRSRPSAPLLVVTIAALGYFVDIYDLFLFSILRVKSLRDLGVSESELLPVGMHLLNLQMLGMLLGGIAWGILGDRRGRVSVLFGSILLYSMANFANAYVHTVEAYAWLRLVAGFGLAGELGAAITLVTEITSSERRGTATAWVAGIGLGGSVAASVMAEWLDWRTCYQVGGALGALLLVSRLSILDSGLFQNMAKTGAKDRGNLWLLVQGGPRTRRYLSCIAAGLPIWFTGGVLITFAPEFAHARGLSAAVQPGRAIMASYIGAAIGDLAAGLLSQRLRSRKKALLVFMAFMVAMIGVYLFLPTRFFGDSTLYWICLWIGIGSGYWAVLITTAAEQFGTNLRATVTTTVPNFVRGSVVPITLAFGFFRHAGGGDLILAASLTGALCVVLAIWGVRGLRESYGANLDFLD